MTANELGNRPASEMTRREAYMLAILPYALGIQNTIRSAHIIAEEIADVILSEKARESQEANDERG